MITLISLDGLPFVPHKTLCGSVKSYLERNCMSHISLKKLHVSHTHASTVVSKDHQQHSLTLICESILQMLKKKKSHNLSFSVDCTFTFAKQKTIKTIYMNYKESYKELPSWFLSFRHYLPYTIIDY